MSAEPYLGRRLELMRRLPSGLILVRGAGAVGLNASFFYLTGLSEPRAALLLAPQGARIGTGRDHPGPDYVRGRSARQILFLPAADPVAARWGEDSAATVESTSAADLRVDAVFPLERIEPFLAYALGSAELLQLVRAAPPSLAGADDADSELAGRIGRRFLHVRLDDASATVHAMRRIKDDGEVRAIEAAVGVTAAAFDALLGALRPGLREHELEAEIARVYRASGATHAFDPIVGSGPNALLLHYRDNRGAIEPGQLVLVDSGASLAGYKADVTRTFPVDGRFDARQREVYEAVLRAQREALGICRPGTTLSDLHVCAWESIERAGFAEFFLHGTSHHLGLETHDVGDPHAALEPGAVITVEPGVYLPDEGIGVRIEDDVLITGDGCRVVTEAIPKDVEEIERRMARR